MKMKRVSNLLLVFIIIFIIHLHSIIINASYSKQDFILENETKIFLDIKNEVFYYNGSISITINIGTVNATVNGSTKTVIPEESKIFLISDTKSIYFSITAINYTEGFFEIVLNDIDQPNIQNPIRYAIGILAALLIAASVIAYYIRSKKLETKPEDDASTTDPEVLRRRKEAMGAEKKFWDFDEK